MSMLQLIYTSRATTSFGPDALRTLLAGARERNQAAGISGMLLHVDNWFLQVLEGDDEVVRALFARITADRRHGGVLALVVREVPERNFPDWSMGFFDGSGRASSLPGYRSTTGFADLTGDKTTLLRVIGDFRDGRWRSIAA